MRATAADVEAVESHVHEQDECLKNNVFSDCTAVVDHAAERSLCFKFDFRILPVLVVMYLFNALDKGNLGNAQTNGLSQNLNFKDGQYNLVVSIFFVPFVIFAPPFAMLAKKYGAARALPVMMFTFGSMTLLTAACQNFGGIFAVRWFLGMAEAAFFPVVIYYLTTFYRRGELARRLAIFYAASNIGNAFSGLLAFGVFHIKSSMYPWRYLFLIEGSGTVLFAIFAFWYLPKSASEAKFLNEEEKALAFHRMQVDSSSVVLEKFSFKEALQIFKYPSSYAFLAIEVCLGVPLQSVALFLPQIIQRLGYSTVKTNLYTVAPSVTGAAVLVLLAFASDFTLGVPLANVMGLVASNIFQQHDAPKYMPALITAAGFGASGALIACLLGLYMIFDNRRRDRGAGIKLKAQDVSTLKLRDGPNSPEFRWYL
ncbi:putative transporter [Metarhizium anisopliae]|nr:putative transporter [Metarhizium anisopliae]